MVLNSAIKLLILITLINHFQFFSYFILYLQAYLSTKPKCITGTRYTCYLHGVVTWPVLWESFLLEWSVFLERNPSIFWLYGVSLVANTLPGVLAIYTNWINFDTCCFQKFSISGNSFMYILIMMKSSTSWCTFLFTHIIFYL